jgi:hypothetical protein
MFEVKPIAKQAIPRAFEKAERYRLLNEPWEAESICLDILAIEPEHPQALTCLLLTLTDQFGMGAAPAQLIDRARQLLQRLKTDYERTYYAGIIRERIGKSLLLHHRPNASADAYQYFRAAMVDYEHAESLAPVDNDDALLRYNCCVRLIQFHKLEASVGYQGELPLE